MEELTSRAGQGSWLLSNSRKQEVTRQKVQFWRQSPGEDKEPPSLLSPTELLRASTSCGPVPRGMLLAGCHGKSRWRVGLAGPTAEQAHPPPPVQGAQELQGSTHIQTLFERSDVTPECYLSQLFRCPVQDLAVLGTLNPTGAHRVYPLPPTGSNRSH